MAQPFFQIRLAEDLGLRRIADGITAKGKAHENANLIDGFYARDCVAAAGPARRECRKSSDSGCNCIIRRLACVQSSPIIANEGTVRLLKNKRIAVWDCTSLLAVAYRRMRISD